MYTSGTVILGPSWKHSQAMGWAVSIRWRGIQATNVCSRLVQTIIQYGYGRRRRHTARAGWSVSLVATAKGRPARNPKETAWNMRHGWTGRLFTIMDYSLDCFIWIILSSHCIFHFSLVFTASIVIDSTHDSTHTIHGIV